MIKNIIPAEHIGLVSAYLSKIALRRSSFGEKYRWINSPLIKKVSDWKNIDQKNMRNWETDNFIEISIYPTGEWRNSESERKEDSKHFAGSGLVKYARNIASAIAHLNETGHNYEGRDGPFHENLERVRRDREHRSKFRGFSYGRKGGTEFRQAAAWAAEYYLDNKPCVKPIPLVKLIHEVKNNLAIHDEGQQEYMERFTEIFYDLQDLCNVAIVQTLWHSKAFKESPETWEDDNALEDFFSTTEPENM